VSALPGGAGERGGRTRTGRAEGPQAWRVSVDQVKARGYNLDIPNPRGVTGDHVDSGSLVESLRAVDNATARLRDQLKAALAEVLAR
jgi:type I restriction enzyme M protein